MRRNRGGLFRVSVCGFALAEQELQQLSRDGSHYSLSTEILPSLGVGARSNRSIKLRDFIISPYDRRYSKLRMKLMGPHHQRKKDGPNDSNSSSRTSPSKLDDSGFVKNSLLASNNGDSDEEVSSYEVPSVKLFSNVALNAGQSDQSSWQPRESLQRENIKMHQFSRNDSVNSSSVHPVRTLEDDNLDCDSNASKYLCLNII